MPLVPLFVHAHPVSFRAPLFQQQEIKGTVRNQQGEPLQGVTVFPKSKPNAGTVTDEQGNFTVTVSSTNETIVFRNIGYVTQELQTSNNMTITLEASDDNLEEVVVVGYGTQKKESLTGAISTVTSKDIARSVAATTSGAMVGKIAGVQPYA